jgi:hypothetical protein
MAKPNRGKNLYDQPSRGRGECPVCKRSSVKILYEHDTGEKKEKICKTCKATIKNRKKSVSVASQA